MYYYLAPKPLGYLVYGLDSVGLVQTIVFNDILPGGALPALAPFSTAFDSYFKNQQAFPRDLLSQDLGGTEFQRAIW